MGAGQGKSRRVQALISTSRETQARSQKRHPSLAIADPELAAQWVRPVNTKDRNKTPENTSAGSDTRVLWRCHENPEHTWEATVNGRSHGKRCPSAEHKAGYLAVVKPELAAQWVRPDHAKDKNKTPENTSVMSCVTVLWRCNENPEHTWEARVCD